MYPGQLPSAAGTAEADQGLDPHDAAGEIGQDRGEGRVPREVPRVPAGGGGGAPPAVRGDSGADRAAAVGVCLGVNFAAFAKAVRTSSPCVRGALCGPISAEEQGRSVLCGGLRPRRGGLRRRFLGETRCNRSSEGVTSADGVPAEAPRTSVWERSASVPW
jgi:hypothetical protein